MKVPSQQEIGAALSLADGETGLTRLLAEMLGALSGFGSENEAAARRVLERLSRGPLSDEDWPEVASSRRGLYVLIGHLRQAGAPIETVDGRWILAQQAVAA